MTARLRAVFGSGFGVRLLRQAWGRPFRGEAEALDLPTHSHALIREVMLHCNGHPLVLARTVIPKQALRGAQCRLAQLGDRPLGELLFAYRGLRRQELEFARVPLTDWRAPIADETGMVGDVWGRRCLYLLASGRLLVCEFFLPAVLAPKECPV